MIFKSWKLEIELFARILKNDVTLKFSIKTSVLQNNSILSNHPLTDGLGVSLDYSWWQVIIFSNPSVIFSNLLRLSKGHELLEHLEETVSAQGLSHVHCL